MSLATDDADLKRLWPIQFNGTRHSNDCYDTMVHQNKHHEIYIRPICKCGLDVWLQMRRIPTTNEQRAREFGWM